MKHRLYKNSIIFITLLFTGVIFGQKFNKNYTENFNVKKDVEVAINASNTEINVTTWNKNQVQVNAFIEIEGLSKKEAEKYFKNWEFEALGNSKKVEITSKGDYNFGYDDKIVLFGDRFSFPDIEIPEIPKIDAIVLPEMDFDFDFDFDFEDLLEGMDGLDEIGRNGRYDFIWNDGKDKVVIKSKKEWEAFKKTKKYKDLKSKLAKSKEKLRKEFKVSKDKMKKQFAKARVYTNYVDKEKVKKQLAKAKETLKKIKFSFSSSNNSDKIIIDGKEIKIKKRIEIKVPKKATFNLNTRHCKVKLPNTVAFGKVKYGTFNANNLLGGKLAIDYSTVNINDLNACTLFLNNVTDAKIASVTNTFLRNNSSGVNILRINDNVEVSDKFGDLKIESFDTNFGEFIINLSQSNAVLYLGKTKTNFKYHVNKLKLDNKRVVEITKNAPKSNIIRVKGDYSTLTIK